MPTFVKFVRFESLAGMSIRVARRTLDRGSQLSLCLVLVVMLGVAWGDAGGQTAHFSSVQTVIASNGLTFPCGTAVDASGNVYVADQGPDTIFKETLSGSTYVRKHRRKWPQS